MTTKKHDVRAGTRCGRFITGLVAAGTLLIAAAHAAAPAGAAGNVPAVTAVGSGTERILDLTQTYDYLGVLTTQVQTYNIYGYPAGVRAYQLQAHVRLAPPARNRYHRESNTFSLLIAPYPYNGVPREGGIEVTSALATRDLLLQYWNLSWTDGYRFNGSLADNHTAEAAANNLLTFSREIAPHITMPFTEAMANGTRLSGYVDTRQVQIRLSGNVTGGNAPFAATINANRAQ